MVQVRYSVKINPRVKREIIRNHRSATIEASKTFLEKTIKLTTKIMKEEAPKRSGALIRGIKEIERRTTKQGQFDRRANLTVASTAPHSIYVVGGTDPSPGAYVGPGSKSWNYKGTGTTQTFPPSRLYSGNKKFRARDSDGEFKGTHPGFEANNFITRSAVKVLRTIGVSQGFVGIDVYTESYNKLKRMFSE